MASATLQVRLDADLKRDTEETLHSMGLNMSTAIQLFCRQVVNQQRLPFEVVSLRRLSDNAKSLPNDVFDGKAYAQNKETDITQSMQAFHNLQKYRKQSPHPRDYKQELADILEERYESECCHSDPAGVKGQRGAGPCGG